MQSCPSVSDENTSCAVGDPLYIATTNLPFLERRRSRIVYTCTYMTCIYTEAPRSEILHVPIVYMLGQTCTCISIRLVILGLKQSIAERQGTCFVDICILDIGTSLCSAYEDTYRMHYVLVSPHFRLTMYWAL